MNTSGYTVPRLPPDDAEPTAPASSPEASAAGPTPTSSQGMPRFGVNTAAGGPPPAVAPPAVPVAPAPSVPAPATPAPPSPAPGGPAAGAASVLDDGLMPWERDALAPQEAVDDEPSFEFTRRDSRKPQLSATLSVPLTDLQRRRSSGSRPAADVSAAELATARRNSGISKPNHRSLSGPRAVQKLRASDVWYDPNPAPDDAAGVVSPALDLRWILGLSFALGGVALTLPAGAGAAESPLWRAAIGAIPVHWPAGLSVAVIATVLALCSGLWLWGARALSPDPTGDAAPPAVLIGLVLAAIALLFREASDPNLMTSAMAPMRLSLFGTPLPIWNAVAAAGLFAVGQHHNHRLARTLAGLGVLAMLIAWWMPMGWIGSSHLPILAALRTLATDGSAIAANDPAAPLVSAPGWVVLQATLALALAGLLIWPRQVSVWWLRGAATLALLVGAATPLVLAGPAVPGALGASAQLAALGLLATVLFCCALARLGPAGAHEPDHGAELTAVVGVLICFLVLKMNGMRHSATDEGIYFYAARAWAEGIWPYHDFFFSHPPLHIAVPTALFALFGYSFALAKSISAVAAAIAGVLIWRMGRRYLSPMTGVLAMALFLFSAEVLKASTNLTGVNLTTMWVVLGLWVLLKRKEFLAGMILGVAVGTGIYAAAIALAAFLLALFSPRATGSRVRSIAPRLIASPAVQLLLGFAIVFGTINLLGDLLAGDAFFDGVYRYHFLKRAKVPGFIPMSEGLHAVPSNFMVLLGSRDFIVSIYYHAAHYWLALLAPATVVVAIALRRYARSKADVQPPQRGPKRTASGFATPDVPDPGGWDLLWHPRRWWLHLDDGGFTLVISVVTFALLLEFAQFKERYDFYYMLILPFLALLAASTLHAIARMGHTAIGCGWAWRQEAQSEQQREVPVPRWLAPLVGGCLLLAALWVPLNMWANKRAFPSEFRPTRSSKGLGERLNFEWLEPPGGAAVSALTAHFMWQPSRLRGNIESGVHHYLWSKKRWFSSAEDIADYVRTHSERTDTITGSSTHAPMVALLADRRMAGDHVDTNAKTFKTGIISRKAFWKLACQDKVKFIVAGPKSWFSPRYMNRKPTVMKYFKLVREFDDPHLKHWRSVRLQLWQRIERSGRPLPCEWVPPDGRLSAAGRTGAARGRSP